MVKRRNLNQAPEKTLADIIAALKNTADQGKTVPHGVKDLGAQGDLVWDGVEGRRSVRDAEKDLAAVNVRLEEAQAKIVQAAEDLETLETDTLPGAVARLEAADQQARTTLAELDDKLGTLAPTADVEALRAQLTQAQEAVVAAQETADAATTAASSANRAALQAAGIAESKGRVIYSETAPGVGDQSTSNLWIKPSTEQTFVWSGSEWEEIESEALQQAAQDALDAKTAAQQAQSDADGARALAQSAQAAAQAAQATADQAALDARDAHNRAVALAGEAEQAAKAYADLVAAGASEDAIQAAKVESDKAAQAAADAQARADQAFALAEAAPTDSDVQALADQARQAAEDAAAADAQARADQAKAEALAESAVTAQEKADAAEAAAIATASADASAKAARALLDAKTAYEEALARARSEITAEIALSANGKNSITVSTGAPSGSGVVAGDTWWQVDAGGTIFGQWTWTGTAWAPRMVDSEVIANLDVHKLRVTGSAAIDEAVIRKLFTEIFAAHKITATELTISAIDGNGDLVPGSVSTVQIADGAVTAPKITVTEELAANVVDAMAVNTKQLIVTDGVTPENAAHVGGVLIDNQGLVVTGEDARVTLDESGLTQYVHDEGNPSEWVPSVQLGVDGTSENVFEAGNTGISRSAVVSPAGSFDTLTVGGSNILDLLDALPKGEVYRYEATEESVWHGSDKETYRVQVSAYLQPGRIYRVEVPSHFVQRRADSGGLGYLIERIRYDFPDRTSAVSSSSPTITQSRHAIPATTLPVTIGGQSGFLRTDDWTAPRWTWVILCVASVGGMDYKHIATASYPLVLSIQDIGASSRMSGRNWMPTGIPTTPTTTPAPAPKPEVVRRTTTWGNGGYGGDTEAGKVYQGTYPPYGNRYGGWMFPPALKTAVKGARIEKFEIYLVNTHWYYGAGGTASITPLRSGYKDMPWYSGTNLRVPGWPRYQARWVTLPASWYPYIANGTYGGMGVRAPDGFEFYGRWQGTATKFRATYVK